MSQRDDSSPSAPGPSLQPGASAAGLDPEAIGASVRRARRKGKRGVSRPFRDLVAADRHLSRAAHRMARAAAKGLATYREGQQASAEAKRDGAVIDQPLNAAQGLAVVMVAASRAPVDLARAMTTRPGRRLVRRMARLVGVSIG